MAEGGSAPLATRQVARRSAARWLHTAAVGHKATLATGPTCIRKSAAKTRSKDLAHDGLDRVPATEMCLSISLAG